MIDRSQIYVGHLPATSVKRPRTTLGVSASPPAFAEADSNPQSFAFRRASLACSLRYSRDGWQTGELVNDHYLIGWAHLFQTLAKTLASLDDDSSSGSSCDEVCNGSKAAACQSFTAIVKVGCIPVSSGLCYATVWGPSASVDFVFQECETHTPNALRVGHAHLADSSSYSGRRSAKICELEERQYAEKHTIREFSERSVALGRRRRIYLAWHGVVRRRRLGHCTRRR